MIIWNCYFCFLNKCQFVQCSWCIFSHYSLIWCSLWLVHTIMLSVKTILGRSLGGVHSSDDVIHWHSVDVVEGICRSSLPVCHSDLGRGSLKIRISFKMFGLCSVTRMAITIFQNSYHRMCPYIYLLVYHKNYHFNSYDDYSYVK